MRIFLLTTFFALTSAFAGGLDQVKVQELNLNYTKPYGKGDVEKISIGFSAKNLGPYPVEVHRREKTLELNSPFLDATWNNPWTFFHDLEHLSVEKVNAQFARKDHWATIVSGSLTPKDNGPFSFNNLSVKCKGLSVARQVEDRIMDDCRDNLVLTIDTLDVPMDFFVSKIVSELPPQPTLKDDEKPADSLKLVSEKGDFSMVVYTRVVFYAGLRAWGHVSYENDHRTVVVRIDQIKFGHLPITAIVMRELRRRINHPDVTITGNTIRININL